MPNFSRRQTYFRSIRVAAILSVAFATPAIAQDTAWGDKRDRWSISIGADPTQSTGSPVFSENFVAAVAREWARRDNALGFRTQLMAGLAPSRSTLLGGDFTSRRIITERRSFAEVSTAATYTFRRKTNFSPYLLAGPALYAVRSSYSVTNAVLGAPGNSSTALSLGATAGAGLSFILLGKEILIEQRIAIPETSTTRRGSLVVRPFTLGIRF